MSADTPPPSRKAAERLAVIVDAAERAALSVIDDAEKEDKRYLEDARARADQIVAERLREAADMLDRQGPADPEPTLRAAPTPEEAAAHDWTEQELALAAQRRSFVSVGTPEQVRDDLERRRTYAGADELVITTQVHDVAERALSYELLAKAYSA